VVCEIVTHLYRREVCMKNKIHTWRSLLPAMLVLFAGQIQAGTVIWGGGPIVVTNVTDQNIFISGANTMGTNINVHAVTQDILISVTAIDSSITSTVNNTVFCLQADLGRTITMNLTDSLAFVAASNLTIPFIVDFQGPGNLVVNIEGGKQFALTKQVGATVGTWFFEVMDATALPTVTFARNPALAVPNSNAQVFVDGLSVISYLAQVPVSAGTSTEQGAIRFDPTNPQPNYGALSLVIANQGSVMVGGHLYTPGTCPNFGSINMSQPAGLEAILTSTNRSISNSTASFLIYNSNTTYSPNLLIDPFCIGTYNGILNGFTLQANGELLVSPGSYLFYIGLATNVAPLTDVLGPCGWALHQVVKDRNPSAFVVDGNPNPNAIPAQINLSDDSAIYFASAADCGGCQSVVQTGSVFVQVFPSNTDVTGAGNTVLDVEGRLNVVGGPLHDSAINIVSLVVNLLGGSVLIEDSTTNFPLRTYALNSDGTYQRFNRSNVLLNNVMRLTQTNLKHDDQSHNATVQFLPGNSLLLEPEPTYIGGERNIVPPSPCAVVTVTCNASGNNAIEFFNSCFLLHTNAAATGLTLRVPNDVNANFSCFKFYSNGLCVDNGGGRNLILGGIIGALATDGQHVIDPNAHIDILQTTTATSLVQTLSLVVGYNNQKVTEGLTGNIQGQDVVESIIQLYGSNICVGTDTTTTQTSPFSLLTTPSLVIAGNYFNFITQGGQLRDASTSGSSGQGGIYVDTNGSFFILPNLRALIGEVIAISDNGYVNLPSSQVLFWQGAGFQRWRLNLTQTSQQVVVPVNQNLSNFTIDWQTTVKDFCVTNSYVPYQFDITDPVTGCPFLAYRNPYVVANLTGLPIIQGTVEQLQLKNSRIGDQAQAIVDGGLVREVVFLNNDTPGYAPVGSIIIQNGATVGIGTSNRNVTSVQAEMVLGTNGLTLVANGNGTVMLNQDVLINNLCHILTGTNFGLNGHQELLITSQVPREIRVKGTGILDLTQFNNYNKRLTIGGQVKIVLEPGAQIVQGSGELYLTDNAEMALEPFVGSLLTTTTSATNSDQYRVKFSSVCTGSNSTVCPSRFTLQENAILFIPRGALLGVETNTCTTFTTSQSWFINDDAQILIGGNETVDEYGGGLQIGNTTNQPGSAIDWSLTINGDAAVFELGSQGFFGTGLGIVNKPEGAPDTWTIDSLSNVRTISITDLSGSIRAQSLFIGSNKLASLIALGSASGSYTFSVEKVNGEILGGSNVITTGAATGSFNPVVGTTAGAVSRTGTQGQTVNYSVGILASQASLFDVSKVGGSPANPYVTTGSAATIFNFITMNPFNLQTGKTAVVAPTTFHSQSLGYVYNGTIYRALYTSGFRSGGISVGASSPLLIGAAGLTGTPPTVTATVLNP
jgi:hypothetical protein